MCIETLYEYSLDDSEVKVLLELDSGHCPLTLWIVLLHLFHFIKGSFRVLLYFDMFFGKHVCTDLIVLLESI